jgi:peptide/nickel transport system ATP-binding protein
MALETCASLTPPVKHPDKMSMYRCVHDDLAAAGPVTPNLAADKSHRVSQGVVLRATGLERRYHVGRGIFAKPVVLRAVAGVNLSVQQGEVLAIVGESGCGKSTLGRLLLGLEPADAGDVVLLGRPIGAIGGRERARLIQPVFQDPRGSLNPRRSVSAIIRRPLDVHRIGTPDERTKRVRDVMDEVGLPSRVFHSYPGQMSGGQRQRVAIARALVMNPSILLCDEPTSALDVSVQAQILNLLLDLRDRMGLTFILITHDLSVVEHMADRVAVMYLGEIVEEGPAEAIFRDAENPYTRALIQSALPLAAGSGVPSARIRPGFPNPLERPEGCTFSPRCPDVLPVCGHVVPARHQRTRGQGFAAYHLRANIGVAEAGAADRGVSAPS